MDGGIVPILWQLRDTSNSIDAPSINYQFKVFKDLCVEPSQLQASEQRAVDGQYMAWFTGFVDFAWPAGRTHMAPLI